MGGTGTSFCSGQRAIPASVARSGSVGGPIKRSLLQSRGGEAHYHPATKDATDTDDNGCHQASCRPRPLVENMPRGEMTL